LQNIEIRARKSAEDIKGIGVILDVMYAYTKISTFIDHIEMNFKNPVFKILPLLEEDCDQN